MHESNQAPELGAGHRPGSFGASLVPESPDPLSAYLTDAVQRWVLFWDVLRQRGNQYLEHTSRQVPHVLQFDATVVMDGRTLPRPVNYGLVAITPPPGVTVDRRKRPFVVIDPRAGHGPGIGGFKADSEIGVALHAGHPCYFIGFLPTPVPGQTIEDVTKAEAAFLERVVELHPEAEGRPVVIGNCQGGWAAMMLAATRPELCGPVIAAGAPLAYWAGVHGANRLRYKGGLLQGSWMTALAGDLGGGIFDGAHLVANFENMNPSNTLWTKQYNLYAKVDSEAPRYLGFERWWGGHVLLNAEEMQWIADNLFIGNKLSTAEIVTSEGVRIDLRNISSPIIIFCSKGDDITPPQQALGWIPDLYDSVADIRANGQTIVYCIHESIGHLGIFVSGSIAKREHTEFASNIDFIDCLPPGLYEAVLVPIEEARDIDPSLAVDGLVLRIEHRSVDAIRALGGNDLDDERKFAAVRRLSEINLGLYRTLVQPWLRAWVSRESAETLRQLNPARMQYEMLSDRNPWLAPLEAMAGWVHEHRRPAPAENPFVAMQDMVSKQIVAVLDGYREARDGFEEAMFHAVYGSPVVQAALGLRQDDAPPRARPGRDPAEIAFVQRQADELRARFGEGGPRAAFVRAIIYVRIPQLSADERSFLMLRKIRDEYARDMTLAQFKAMFREQFMLVLLDPEEALRALPQLLDGQLAKPEEALQLLIGVVSAAGSLIDESTSRLERVASIYRSLRPRTASESPAPGRRGLKVADAPRAAAG